MDCPYCKVGTYSDFCKCMRQDKEPICPHVYRCPKLQIWKKLASMDGCIVRQNQGNVKMERRGYLYVQINDQVVKIKNPYDYVPSNVKVKKYKGKYMVVKENKE